MIKRFAHYYKPYMKMFTWDMIFTFLLSLTTIFYPLITRTMLNQYIPNQDMKMLLISGGSLLVIYILRFFMNHYVTYYGHIVGVYMQADMRRELFKKLERLPVSYYDSHETGKIMSRMVSDLQEVAELAHHGPEMIFITTFTMIATFVYLCTINWLLSVIVFGFVPVLFMVSLIMRKRQTAAFTKTRKELAVINANLENSVSGIRVTKAFTNDEHELDRFEKGNESFKKARKEAYKTMADYSSYSRLIVELLNAVVLIAGGIFTYRGVITYADLIAFMISISLFINPVQQLINWMEMFNDGSTGFKRFLEIMDLPEEYDSSDARDIDKVKGEIEFKKVSFKYETSNEILHNVNLKIKAGEKLALVGPSGGGKTTICHLIPQFYQLDEGEITIDKIPIRNFTLKSLRQNVGVVQQDVFLFTGTIKENIAYGKLDATEQEIINAAKKANIYDFIMSLPDKFETDIGEHGLKLSGGQKQRISIARIFLKDPKILILDEATSALDNTTEMLIQKSLDDLCKGRTTIIVAHRLSTIKSANEIAVINNGKVIEKGSHDELMKKKGIYKELYDLQFRTSGTSRGNLFDQ